MTFQLTSTDEHISRGTFPELRRELVNMLTRRGRGDAAARVSWWQEDAPMVPDIRGAFWSIVAAGVLYEIHDQGPRLSWLDPGVIGRDVPHTHRLTVDDVETFTGSFAACALTMHSRFVGLSLEVLARLDPTDAELAEWDSRHGDPMAAPWLSRRLTDDEHELQRRYRNLSKFAERLEPDAVDDVVSVVFEAGGVRYGLERLEEAP